MFQMMKRKIKQREHSREEKLPGYYLPERKFMKRFYVVVYLSAGGMHYRFRCYANGKREARRECKGALGIKETT